MYSNTYSNAKLYKFGQPVSLSIAVLVFMYVDIQNVHKLRSFDNVCTVGLCDNTKCYITIMQLIIMIIMIIKIEKLHLDKLC